MAARRGDHRSVAANRRSGIRHPGRHANARSQAQVIRPLPAPEERVNETGEDGGNDGRVGKRGKPNPGFPSFPTALGNRYAIPTFPPPLRFLCLKTFKTKFKKGDPGGGSLRSHLQAHSSMRKCLLLGG